MTSGDSHPSITDIISIHTPTKGVTLMKGVKAVLLDISIHTPTKGVTFKFCKKCNARINFNPHSHEGSDLSESVGLTKTSISIHTPTKGVTNTLAEILGLLVISIHTPTKGVTIGNYSLDNSV